MTSTDVTQPVTPAGPSQPPRRGPSAGRLVTGLLLVLVGVVWLLNVLDVAEIRWQTVLSAAVIAIGAALLSVARRGDNDGLIGLGVGLSILLVFTAGMPNLPLMGGIGDRNLRPTGEVESAYELGMGTLELDLTAADLSPGTTEISASVGMGELVVIVPTDVALDIDASVGAGEVDVLGEERNGIAPSLSVSESGGDQRLVLDLSVGLGTIEVQR